MKLDDVCLLCDQHTALPIDVLDRATRHCVQASRKKVQLRHWDMQCAMLSVHCVYFCVDSYSCHVHV